MFGLGTQELVVILIVAFFIFGAKKLPEIGRDLGKGIRAFKKGLRDMEEEGRELLSEAEQSDIDQKSEAEKAKGALKDTLDDLPGVKETREVKEDINKLREGISKLKV